MISFEKLVSNDQIGQVIVLALNLALKAGVKLNILVPNKWLPSRIFALGELLW